MPITPAYSWHESPTWVTIDITLRSVSPAAADILTTESYVKVNCSPYLFQVDLYGEIEINKSSAIVDKDMVQFFLVKKGDGLWGRLNATGDRKEILLRREKSLELERQRTHKVKADAKVKSAQLGRLAVQSQLKLDEGKRKLVDQRKAEELKQERDVIELWQENLKQKPYSQSRCFNQESPPRENNLESHLELHGPCSYHSHSVGDDICFSPLNPTAISRLKSFKGDERAFDASSATKSMDSVNFARKIQECKFSELPEKILPAPRGHMSVSVKFTPKHLSINLPARESRDNVQLKGNRSMSSDAVDISERQPLFLQDKGDNFYRNGDFRSAINAYTHALQKDPLMLLCFANRAASFLQLKQFKSCIEDCEVALQLLGKKGAEVLEERLQVASTETTVSSFSGKQVAEIISRKTDEIPSDACICELIKKHGSMCNAVRSFVQESLQLLGSSHSEASLGMWCKFARRQILVRHGTALCHATEVDKAKSDFDEALSLNLTSQEMEDISREIKGMFVNKGYEENVIVGM